MGPRKRRPAGIGATPPGRIVPPHVRVIPAAGRASQSGGGRVCTMVERRSKRRNKSKFTGCLTTLFDHFLKKWSNNQWSNKSGQTASGQTHRDGGGAPLPGAGVEAVHVVQRLVKSKWSKASGPKQAVKSKWSKASGQKQVVKSKRSKASGQKQVVKSKWLNASGRKQVVKSKWSKSSSRKQVVKSKRSKSGSGAVRPKETVKRSAFDWKRIE